MSAPVADPKRRALGRGLDALLPAARDKAPAYGDRRRAMLEDIAKLTGATPIMKDLGFDLEKVTIKELGQAKKISSVSRYAFGRISQIKTDAD